MPGEIGELAGVLARAFVRDPFYAYLAGDAFGAHAAHARWLG